MTIPAYTDLPNGARILWHVGVLAECLDSACPYPHATKAQLQEGMEWPESR
jgi:hypothetical protein